MRFVFTLLVFTFSLPSLVVAQSFVSPIGGTAYQDWTIVNYVDLDPGFGAIDYLGGNYTYNGHNAIDFTLPNFAAMDAGVSVNAALGGTVSAVHDGEFDRWSRANPNTSGDLPNYVVIDHGNGVVTEYLHLRKNSITVGVGDTVSAGQLIGQVGSSGNSSDAHLHFAVYENGINTETYQDPSFWWQDPLPYAGDVYGALDHGVINYVPDVNDLVERPTDYNEFDIQDGSQVVRSWANLFGFNNGDDLDYYFYDPSGDEFAHWHWNTGQIRYGWWTASIGLPENAELGTWSIDARRNGVSVFEDTFLVFNSVPEPGTTGVLVAGLLACLSVRRRRQFVPAERKIRPFYE